MASTDIESLVEETSIAERIADENDNAYQMLEQGPNSVDLTMKYFIYERLGEILLALKVQASEASIQLTGDMP